MVRNIRWVPKTAKKIFNALNFSQLLIVWQTLISVWVYFLSKLTYFIYYLLQYFFIELIATTSRFSCRNEMIKDLHEELLLSDRRLLLQFPTIMQRDVWHYIIIHFIHSFDEAT